MSLNQSKILGPAISSKSSVIDTTYGEYIQRNYNTVNASSINNIAKSIYTKTSGKQINTLTDGNYTLTSDNGNISLVSGNDGNTAIQFTTTDTTGGITMTSGTGGLILNTTGTMEFKSSGNVSIGSSTTDNIDILATESVTLSADSYTVVTTNNITHKSTNGQIILDTSGNSGESALRVVNTGEVVINSDTYTDGFQLEVHTNDTSTSVTDRNGILLNSSNSSITPEFRIKYQNSDETREVINTMGVYSDNSKVAKYREYVGYQYGNQLITIEGNEFEENDIGKNIVFSQDNRNTTITDTGTIILPADNTYSSSNLTVGGVYTGTSTLSIKIEIDTLSTENGSSPSTDTFKWSIDGGYSFVDNFVPLSYAYGQRYPLQDGIYIEFAQLTGHSLNDFWTFKAMKTAIVNSNIIITGSITNNSISGTVVTGVSNNVVSTNVSVVGSSVFSNITSNMALSRLQKFITLSPYNGYIGTTTNSDLVFITADVERFRVTADGSLGVSKENIDAKLHLTSNYNKPLIVNDNVVSSNVIDGGSITETSNIGVNLLGYQLNPVSTELNTGGYVIMYESQENDSNYYDIYADYFTGNGEKSGISFVINTETTKDQSHPYITKSGTVTSNNYLAVWVSQDPNNASVYQIRGQIFKNGNTKLYNTDIIISNASTNVKLVPRAVGLSNGNYVVTYSSLENDDSDSGTTENYHISYVILNSLGVEVKTETQLTTGDEHYIHPSVGALSKKDPNYPGGFVICYMKQTYTTDPRYQIVYKVLTVDGSSQTAEREITNTGITDYDDLKENSDISLTDGLINVQGLSDTQIKQTDTLGGGGFLVSYQTNYSASVIYTDIINTAVRNVFGVSGNANGNLTGAVIDSTTGIQTLTLTSVNGSFLKGEQIYLVAKVGYLTEKIESVSVIGTTATVVLSKDPKQIILTRFSTANLSIVGSDNVDWRSIVNTTNLVLDNERVVLNASENLPFNFIRSNSIFYGYRNMATLKHNNIDEALVAWQNGAEPDIYYQRVNITDGSLVSNEELIATTNIGIRQTDPYISTLKTKQGNILGYDICFSSSSLDLSKTGIYQQLIGPYSNLLHINNNTVEFVADNEGRMGVGTKAPDASLHIKTIDNKNPLVTDTASFILQNSTTNINNVDDSHRISFKDGSGTELARMKVKYSEAYQNMYPKSENLVSYYKFDEISGSLTALDSGLFNIQSDTSNVSVNNKVQNGLLVNFDVNKCWIDGKVNNALLFDGINNYVKVPMDTTSSSTIDRISNGDFTISFWLNINSNIFSGKRIDLLSFGTVDIDNTTSSGAFNIYLEDTENKGILHTNIKYIRTGDIAAQTPIEYISSSTIINDGSYHHLIIRYDSTTFTFSVYLDNVNISSVGSSVISVALKTITTDLDTFIGSKYNGSGNYYRGSMDELRFYNTTLTTTDIGKLYKYGNEKRGQLVIQTKGNNTDFDDIGPGLVLDDTGKIASLKVRNNIFRQLTGKLIANLNNTTITGEDTLFIKELSNGDFLYIDNKSSALESAGDLGSQLNQKLYKVNNIVSDTELTLNRIIPDVTEKTYLTYVTVRPSILSASDLDDNTHMVLDYSGDLVLGNGKAIDNMTKFEIRGDGLTSNNKNGLTISNTSLTGTSSEGGSSNKLLFRGNNTTGTETIRGIVDVSHSGTSNDHKSKLTIKLNNDTTSTDLTNVGYKHGLTLFNDGKANFGQSVALTNMKGDIHLSSQADSSGTIAMFSNQAASGIFTEENNLTFYGNDSYESNSSALAKMMVSNDKYDSSHTSVANGRFDFFTNNYTDSDERDANLISRMSITAQGKVGIHIQKPVNIFTASPKFIKSDGGNVFGATIANNTDSTINFDNSIFGTTALSSQLLRCGSITINDGSNLNVYSLASNIGSDKLLINNSNVRLDNSSALTGLTLDGTTSGNFSLHYPGINVNKYGLVSIGDNRFSDTDTTYHFNVSGDTVLKGKMDIMSNIDSTSSNVSLQNNNDRLEIRDSSTGGGYIKLFGGPISSNIQTITATTYTILWTDSTILADTTSDNITLTLPDPTNYTGRKFEIKKINAANTLTIDTAASKNIDGSASISLSANYESRTLQTNGIDWFIISKYTP